MTQYKRIANRISDDAVSKKNFLVDIGDQPLTTDLSWHLAEYNTRHHSAIDHEIKQQVVLSEGKTYTITLR